MVTCAREGLKAASRVGAKEMHRARARPFPHFAGWPTVRVAPPFRDRRLGLVRSASLYREHMVGNPVLASANALITHGHLSISPLALPMGQRWDNRCALSTGRCALPCAAPIALRGGGVVALWNGLAARPRRGQKSKGARSAPPSPARVSTPECRACSKFFPELGHSGWFRWRPACRALLGTVAP